MHTLGRGEGSQESGFDCCVCRLAWPGLAAMMMGAERRAPSSRRAGQVGNRNALRPDRRPETRGNRQHTLVARQVPLGTVLCSTLSRKGGEEKGREEG